MIGIRQHFGLQISLLFKHKMCHYFLYSVAYILTPVLLHDGALQFIDFMQHSSGLETSFFLLQSD